MADFIIVTYDYRADTTTPEPFEGSLEEARDAVAGTIADLLQEHPTWRAVPTPSEWRMQCLVDRRAPGMAKVTIRINDAARHCRTCRCHVSAFA